MQAVYAARVEPQDPAQIALRIAELKQEHRQLDEAIAKLVADIEADEVAIKRLKKRKLWLKDCISRLESALIPDEPA
ncbi:YdcH family protein [Pseudoxanthomonas wuyuanensis]